MKTISREKLIRALELGLDANNLVGDGGFRENEWDDEADLIRGVIEDLKKGSTLTPHNEKRKVRNICEIAREIQHHWRKVNCAAVPHLRAMHNLDTIDDTYGHDSARSFVSSFLANASTWRGKNARRIKTELLEMLRST